MTKEEKLKELELNQTRAEKNRESVSDVKVKTK